MKIIEILVNKTICLGLSILETRKMYEFWYNYVEPKYGQKCKSNAKGVEIRFNTSYYELGRSLPRGKNKALLN